MASSRDLAFASTALAALCALGACGGNNPGGDPVDAPPPPIDVPCEGLQCKVVDCASKGLPSTSLSGTVHAPNGTLPLYGVTVYVPASDPGPLPDGVQCGNCARSLPGGSIAQAITDENGRFTLPDVPATTDVPLVITTGKWRRQLVIPNVAACQDTALPAASTRLPKNKAEGDIPRIAVTTGSADALECLVRKLGIDDSEFTTEAGNGRVHLFNGNGVNQFEPGYAGGSGTFPAATTLWSSANKLSNYDVAILSCEGAQYTNTKPQTSLQALRDYANLGGRIFLSHWHNIWVGGDPDDDAYGIPEWKTIGTFDYGADQQLTTAIASIDLTVEKGVPFATWLENVGASTTYGQITVNSPRFTLKANDPEKSDRRVYVDPSIPANQNRVSVQDLQFTTPNDVPKDQRCGKVVFSDMHVSANSRSRPSVPFPRDCSAAPLTAQEKALAFLFFDISSCVGVIQ